MPRFFFRQTVGIYARNRLQQGCFAVVNVSGSRNNHFNNISKTVAHLQGSVNPATIVRHKYDQSPALAIHASGRLMTQGGYRVHHGV